ncbi:MAG TPA: DUF3501 family protein [Myxococcales bacterium]|nr:DUF3501 family protein [Myxococcales bacterium]
MKHLTASDLWPLPVYEGVRAQFRAEVIEAKKNRRVTVGPYMTFIFENRLTVKFQIQEILRIERISAPAQVDEEVEGFNSMLPDPGELSASLLIELTGKDEDVKAELHKLYGLSKHIWLEVAGKRIQGVVEGGREEEARGAAAVQYLRFPAGDQQALLQGPAFLVVDHPHYNHRLELSEAVRRSLAQDLQ